MSATNREGSLFEQLGGVAGITRLVAQFYDRVLADPDLSPYFEHVALDKLRRMQFEFFSAALGATTRYSGRSIMQAHAGRRITLPHFRLFVHHLAVTLEDTALGPEQRDDVLARIEAYSVEVVRSEGT